MREDRVYLEHIRDALDRVVAYTQGGRDVFLDDPKTQDAVIRNLEIVGEAVKQLSIELMETYPDIPWKRISGFRDVLIHHYFGIKLDTVWEVVQREIPVLRAAINQILKS